MPRPADMPTLRGLPNPNTTPLPNCIVDDYLPFFTGAELKVILYLVRRTLGFHKTRDAISLNQICNGIVRKDGRRLDRGTGLHKSTACDALNALTGWGMITRVTRRDPVRGDLPTEYILWIEGESGEEASDPRADGSGPIPAPTPSPGIAVAERCPQASAARSGTSVPPVSGLADTPLSVWQDTPVSGQTDRQNLASQEKHEQEDSNTRHSHPECAAGKHRGRVAWSTPTADHPFAGEHAPQISAPPQNDEVSDPTRAALHPFAEVIVREFNDRAPFRATLSRLVNLYHHAGLPMDAFADRFDAARQRTKERTTAIRPPTGEAAADRRTAKNKIPYFFALLEELLGLREGLALPVAEPVRADPPVRDTPPPVPSLPSPDETNAVGCLEDTPSAVTADADARVIGAVVREFSRQFTDYATAVALGDWAIARWRSSGLSQARFLEVAGAASEELVRARSTVASAPLFRARLVAALGEPVEGQSGVGRRGPGSPPLSLLGTNEEPLDNAACPRDKSVDNRHRLKA